MNLSIDFAPPIAAAWIWLDAALAAVSVFYALWRRARGALARAVAFAIACAALANPLIVRETREPLPDIVALIVDHSASMDIGHRRAEADEAAAEIAKKLSADKTIELRRAEVRRRRAKIPARNCFRALASALADAPPDRIAGAIAITDGEVHDAVRRTWPICTRRSMR